MASKDCPDCNHGKCRRCNGTGDLSDPISDMAEGILTLGNEMGHDCPDCNGSGDCPTCDGTGEVDD